MKNLTDRNNSFSLAYNRDSSKLHELPGIINDFYCNLAGKACLKILQDKCRPCVRHFVILSDSLNDLHQRIEKTIEQ
jgi:hypothetical protein